MNRLLAAQYLARTVPAMTTLPLRLLDQVTDLIGTPIRVLRGPETGVSGSTIAVIAGPARRVFVKWPSCAERAPAIQAEARILHNLGADLPDGSPRVLAVGEDHDPFLITEVVTGVTTWTWDLETVIRALLVLDRFAQLPPVGGPLTKTNIVNIDHYRQVLDHVNVPQQVRDDVLSFAQDLHHAQEVFCHGDAHPDNWLIDPSGAPIIIDFEHAGTSPRGWDPVMLLSLIDGVPGDTRAELLTVRCGTLERARILTSVMAAKVLHRRSRRLDRFAEAFPAVIDLWHHLT